MNERLALSASFESNVRDGAAAAPENVGGARGGPLVRLEHVGMTYRPSAQQEVRALDDISLTAAAGEWVVLWGPSGSGKSSLLHILGGLLTPTAGKLEVNGRAISALSARDRAGYRLSTVGFVFQSFHLLPHLRTWENVSLPLIAAGIAAAHRRERAYEALERVGLTDRRQHFPAELSGGEQQRVALARATALRPRVILADEPTGSLDQANATRVLELLDGFVAQGAALICATHDRQVASHASRVIRLSHGVIDVM